MRSTMGKNMLKGVWVFLALVGLVVAPTLISSGQGTITVVQKPGDKVLDEYDVFTIHMLMSRSLESLEQHISHDWSYIPNHEGASSSLLTLQRKLEEQDVLETLIVLDTLPELLDDDLIWRALLKAWTTLEDEEELLETHFGKKTSQNKHVVLTKGAFQSFLTQLRGEPSESDEVQTSASKLVIMDGEPQLLKLQELRVLFEAYVQTTLLYQEQQSKQKPPGRSIRKSGSHIREAAATDSKVVLTKDAFRCLLKQVKLDTLQDEDHESSRSVDQEVSASKVAVSEGQNTSPLMLKKEFLIKLVSQTMSTIYSQSALQDQLKFLGELLDYDLLESLEEPESPSKLITPWMYQRAFFSKELLQTVNTVYGELGLQEKLKMWDAILDLAFQEHLEKTDSPSKLISPMIFLSKILLPTMSTLYGESGLHGQVKFQAGELNQNLPESVEETEPPNKLITPVMHQREFLSKELFQIMSKRYGESGLLDQLKFLERVDLASQDHLEMMASPSKLITPVMHQREVFSKILSQTMNTLYGESGLQDQLKMWDGEVDETKYTVAASSQISDGLKQDAWLSQEARRENTVLKSSASPSSCMYKETLQVVQLYTDSCYKRSGSFTQRMAGLGGLWYDKLKYHVFSTAYSNPHKLHNNDLEMLAIWVALKLHGRGWQGMNVEAYCDNESTVKLLNAYCDGSSLNLLKCKTKSRKQRSSKIQMFIINKINEEVCKYKFSLSTIQIGGKQNCRADMLSRRGIEEFSSHLPSGTGFCEYDVVAELNSFDRDLESWMKTF